MSKTKLSITLLAVFAAFIALDWLVQGENFFMYKFWAPKYEAARRQTYEQTKSYKQGSIQRLNTLCNQVETADDDHKPMVRDIINQEFAEWNTDDVPVYLQGCLIQARR